MAERKEFDLFAYIFNREGEIDQPSTQEEHLPRVEATVDRGEDDANNPTPAVIQPEEPAKKDSTWSLARASNRLGILI